MQKLLVSAFILAACAHSSMLLAAGKKKAKEDTQAAAPSAAYGMAGCGLGALLVKENEMAPQLGAWALNTILVPQTYAISSGTSNCVESRTDVAAMEQSVYVTANLTSLEKEAAQGSGKHLDGLAEVFGCYGDVERVRLGQVSQEQHESIYNAKEPDAVLNKYLAVIQADPMLAKVCLKAS